MTIKTTTRQEYSVKACTSIGSDKLHIIFEDISMADAFALASDPDEIGTITFVADDGVNPVKYEGYTTMVGVSESVIGGVSVTLRR